MKQVITIREVAALAKVSISTVSRVLSNENLVGSEKVERVKNAVKELNYIPNTAARQMHGHGESTIGIITTRKSNQAFGNPYFSGVIGAIGEILENNNYNLQINSFGSTETELESVLKLYRSGRVSGFILLSSRTYDPLIYELDKENIPFVLIGRVIENTLPDHEKICWVNTDNVNTSRKAVEYLLEKGHRNIAILTGPMQYVVSQDRYMGYRQALVTNNIPFNENYSVSAGYTYDDAKNAVRNLIQSNPDITAIFATDDLKGVAAIETILEMGLKIPERMAVIGYDNFDISRIIKPALTTVDVPIDQLGISAATMLMDMIEGKPIVNRHIILDTKMICRESA